MEYTIIRKGTPLPEDFVTGPVINRDKYVVEFGVEKDNIWMGEFDTPVTAEIIGAIVIGSNAYKAFRFRKRTANDETWSLAKTTIGKILNGKPLRKP